MRESLERYPSSFSQWASCMMGEVFGLSEVAVVGEQAFKLADEVSTEFLPQKVLMASKTADDAFPLLKDKQAEGYTLVYLCQNYACQQPVDTIEAFRQLIRQNRSYL